MPSTNYNCNTKHPDPDVRAESAKAIGLLKAQQAVPELIEAWNENRRPLSGGMGIQIAQANLDQTLAMVLSNLTNQTLNMQQKLSEPEIKLVVTNAKSWMSAQANK